MNADLHVLCKEVFRGRIYKSIVYGEMMGKNADCHFNIHVASCKAIYNSLALCKGWLACQ